MMASHSMHTENRNLSHNQVHFWYASLEANRGNLAVFRALLSADEVIRAGRFKFQKNRDCYIVSRGILRFLLGNYLGRQPETIQFVYSDYGKPALAEGNQFKFNCSHSGDLLVFGFTLANEIGVDIEHIKTDFDALDLAQNFFSPEEVRALEEVPNHQLFNSFYRCWTRKEAFIKALGMGLSFPLHSFTVSMDNDQSAELLDIQWNRGEASEWRLYPFSPNSNYVGAIALRSKKVSVVYLDFDI